MIISQVNHTRDRWVWLCLYVCMEMSPTKNCTHCPICETYGIRGELPLSALPFSRHNYNINRSNLNGHVEGDL